MTRDASGGSGRILRRAGYQLLSMMFRSSFSRAAAYSSDSVPCPADCKNAGHLCVAGVDTRTYGTYLGAVSFGRPLINNG